MGEHCESESSAVDVDARQRRAAFPHTGAPARRTVREAWRSASILACLQVVGGRERLEDRASALDSSLVAVDVRAHPPEPGSFTRLAAFACFAEPSAKEAAVTVALSFWRSDMADGQRGRLLHRWPQRYGLPSKRGSAPRCERRVEVARFNSCAARSAETANTFFTSANQPSPGCSRQSTPTNCGRCCGGANHGGLCAEEGLLREPHDLIVSGNREPRALRLSLSCAFCGIAFQDGGGRGV
jgi:hypothetical protein